MDAERFDAVARALATPASRRRFLVGAGVALLGHFLPFRSGVAQPAGEQTCAAPEPWSPGRNPTCGAGLLACWGRCVDPRTNQRNCGACGRACADGKRCQDGVCTPGTPSSTAACRARTLRLWFNAFVPGFAEGYIRAGRTLDGQPVSVFPAPLPFSGSGDALWLLTDRPSSDPMQPTRDDSFSPDPNAPALVHGEVEIDLRTMSIRSQLPRRGRIAQADSGSSEVVRRVCDRPIVEAPGLGTIPGEWFTKQSPGDANPLALRLQAAWVLGEDARSAGGDECPLITSLGELRLAEVRGTILITRDEVQRSVRIELEHLETREAGLETSPFPAFELYAALDDGHLQRVFRRGSGEWADNFDLQLVTAGEDCAASLPCGCPASDPGPCPPGHSCTAAECAQIKGYYVLSGEATLDPTAVSGDILVADGDLAVELPGVVSYRSNAANGQRRIRPIGFSTLPGRDLTITVSGLLGAVPAWPRLFLHRIDDPYRAVQTEPISPVAPAATDCAGQPCLRARVPIDLALQTARDDGICCGQGTTQFCVDPMTDPLNCGGCLAQCPPGQLCLNGACACPYPRRFHDGRCVDGFTDDRACGGDAALVDCAADQRICIDGGCVVPCPAGQIVCDGVGCVDVAADAAHCGRCHAACPTGQPCLDGRCACSGGETFCGDAGCVDTSVHGSHCGACHFGCPSGASCISGGCVCPTGQTACGGNCVDLQFDLANCGFCGNACEANQVCAAGVCCVPEEICGGVCVATCCDDANCGGCGIVCSGGLTCASGVCCVPESICGGLCVSLGSDPAHCGGCDRPCPPFQVCGGGVCCGPEAVCGGLCVDLSSDPDNCGQCGVFCPTCFGGTCPGPPDPPPPPPEPIEF